MNETFLYGHIKKSLFLKIPIIDIKINSLVTYTKTYVAYMKKPVNHSTTTKNKIRWSGDALTNYIK